MLDKTFLPDDPIAAIATALAPAALAIVRASGPGCVDLLSKIFSRPQALKNAAGNSALHGWLQTRGEEGSLKLIDEVMIIVYRAPKSFTGEDSAEVICHGGVQTAESVYELLLKSGFRAAQGGEFTFRSFINGKCDLAKAEAVREIIDAKTDVGREKAALRLSGAFSGAVKTIKEELISCLAAAEVELDYPEDFSEADVDKEKLKGIQTALRAAAQCWTTEKLYQDGVKVLLCGKTNAGKSSLFNALLKEDRAIVSDVHGTTRDWLECWTSFRGIPVRLFDTAGVRETSDAIEKIGLERTYALIKEADAVLYVVDGTLGFGGDDSAFIADNSNPARFIVVWNKSDAPQCADKPPDSNFIAVSAKTGAGIETLIEAVCNVLLTEARSENGSESYSRSATAQNAAPGSRRQKESLEAAAAALDTALADMESGQPLDMLAQDIAEAINRLDEITGETAPDTVLEEVFSRFCVGK